MRCASHSKQFDRKLVRASAKNLPTNKRNVSTICSNKIVAARNRRVGRTLRFLHPPPSPQPILIRPFNPAIGQGGGAAPPETTVARQRGSTSKIIWLPA